ncbi:MAG: excinuclease ABC subunit C [Bacteroidetes bacterium HGW-Bacteroidetes-6]|jgi:hypothetical protein|nr:MAG: excinuclease ABC subunit C [Bacteroidetes bacterium HGW-Bacteroidetes-6]
MGIKKKWSDYKKEIISDEDNYFAAYELANKDKITIYIGEGLLKSKLLAHLPNGSEPVVGTSYYRYELTGSKEKCVSRKNDLLKDFMNDSSRNYLHLIRKERINNPK